MNNDEMLISSVQNPRVKQVVKLRKQSERQRSGVTLIEGYREILRALENNWPATTLFYCRDLFLGENEDALIKQCRAKGADIVQCTGPVFQKMSYRDRPDGLLALAPIVQKKLSDLNLSDNPLVLVAEHLEKPGNLGTLLRSADAAGVEAVIVCDKCTDINNPNVVRASIGTLFYIPIAEASTDETLAFLREKNIQILAATPHATEEYFEVNMTTPTAIVVGAEQFGLSDKFMSESDLNVRIPMLGKNDSLNVSTAATILLYEAVRQRRAK